MRSTSVVVIGGGPAGITFSRELRKLDPSADVVMFRPEPHSMIYCAIPYAIEGLFDPAKVFKSDGLVTDVGVELVRRAVRAVDLERKRVTDDAGETLSYRTLFIALGASPTRPPLPGSDAPNVFTVKTGQDMTDIIARVKAGTRRAVVVGAGAIGVEQAHAYRKQGIETWLVDVAPRVLPNMVDEDMSEPLHAALAEDGVKLVLGASVQALETDEAGVRRVALSDGAVIDLSPERDFVCFSIGMKPDVELFRDSGLEMARDGIVVDARMRTNIPDVYAAGDCCAFYSCVDGQPLGGKLATNAVPMAKTAARVVAGVDDEYPGFVNGAATCVGDWRVGSTGFTAAFSERRGFEPVVGYGETTTLFPMMPGAEALRVKIVADKISLRVLGGQVLSKQPTTDKVDVISLAIQRRMTLKGLARLSYSAQPWQSFFPARNAIVEACENALDVYWAAGGPTRYEDLEESV